MKGPGARCKVCAKACRARAIFLFETPRGPVYVCGKTCLAAYNGTDTPEEPCDCAAHNAGRVVA